jgi:hypothetical protein
VQLGVELGSSTGHSVARRLARSRRTNEEFTTTFVPHLSPFTLRRNATPLDSVLPSFAALINLCDTTRRISLDTFLSPSTPNRYSLRQEDRPRISPYVPFARNGKGNLSIWILFFEEERWQIVLRAQRLWSIPCAPRKKRGKRERVERGRKGKEADGRSRNRWIRATYRASRFIDSARTNRGRMEGTGRGGWVGGFPLLRLMNPQSHRRSCGIAE